MTPQNVPFVPHPFRWRCACSPNVTFSTVLAPACQENHIFQTNFNNSCLSPISSILHRCARVTFPMVWRTRRFVAVRNAIYYNGFLTNSLLAHLRPSFALALVLATLSFQLRSCLASCDYCCCPFCRCCCCSVRLS